jgi:hypothetical protein
MEVNENFCLPRYWIPNLELLINDTQGSHNLMMLETTLKLKDLKFQVAHSHSFLTLLITWLMTTLEIGNKFSTPLIAHW